MAVTLREKIIQVLYQACNEEVSNKLVDQILSLVLEEVANKVEGGIIPEPKHLKGHNFTDGTNCKCGLSSGDARKNRELIKILDFLQSLKGEKWYT